MSVANLIVSLGENFNVSLLTQAVLERLGPTGDFGTSVSFDVSINRYVMRFITDPEHLFDVSFDAISGSPAEAAAEAARFAGILFTAVFKARNGASPNRA